MTRIKISEDCGNSPKNLFVQQLTIAFASGDSKFLLNSVTDDIRWDLVGDQVVQGKDPFAQALEEMKKDQVLELTLRHITTHGKAGAADGSFKFENGKTRAFCYVYEFSNAKATSIKEITSYIIEIK